ncbi:hypothetical protein [Dokdonella sp.]|uniref:hypothetical protein n=1 Tax=Dokdonella sp. TaxID=2291710 RepID=UPI003C45A238
MGHEPSFKAVICNDSFDAIDENRIRQFMGTAVEQSGAIGGIPIYPFRHTRKTGIDQICDSLEKMLPRPASAALSTTNWQPC